MCLTIKFMVHPCSSHIITMKSPLSSISSPSNPVSETHLFRPSRKPICLDDSLNATCNNLASRASTRGVKADLKQLASVDERAADILWYFMGIYSNMIFYGYVMGILWVCHGYFMGMSWVFYDILWRIWYIANNMTVGEKPEGKWWGSQRDWHWNSHMFRS